MEERGKGVCSKGDESHEVFEDILIAFVDKYFEKTIIFLINMKNLYKI